MFTASPPESQGARVHLFFSAQDAQAANGPGRPVYPVAVHYDALFQRLVSLEPVEARPVWSAPASHGDDGTVATTGPIPHPLFLTPEWTPFALRAIRPS